MDEMSLQPRAGKPFSHASAYPGRAFCRSPKTKAACLISQVFDIHRRCFALQDFFSRLSGGCNELAPGIPKGFTPLEFIPNILDILLHMLQGALLHRFRKRFNHFHHRHACTCRHSVILLSGEFGGQVFIFSVLHGAETTIFGKNRDSSQFCFAKKGGVPHTSYFSEDRIRTPIGVITVKACANSCECLLITEVTIAAFLAGVNPANLMRTTPAETRRRRNTKYPKSLSAVNNRDPSLLANSSTISSEIPGAISAT